MPRNEHARPRSPALAVTVDGDGREAYDARQVNWRASGLVQLRSWVDCPDAVRARQCLAILLPEPLPGRRPGGYGLQLDVSTAGYRLVTGNDGLADAYVIDARMSPEIQPRTIFVTPRYGLADRLELRLLGPGDDLPAGVNGFPVGVSMPNQQGPAQTPVLNFGAEDLVRPQFELNQAWYAFLLGAFILIGLSYLSLWLARRSERSFLLFGLFCLLVAVLVAVMGDRYIFLYFIKYLHVSIHAIFIDRARFLAIVIVAPVFLHFVCELFGGPRTVWIVRIAYAVSGIVGVAMLLLPPLLAQSVLGVYQLWSLLLALVILAVLARAWRRRLAGARLALPGVIVLFLAGAFDVVINAGAESGGLVLLAPALFVFVLIQGAMLSTRFAWAFAMFESVSQKLQRSNRRPEDLQTLHLELDTARTIQQSLIPVAPPEMEGVRLAARYRAMQIVGGDFYDFRTNVDETSERRGQLGVILADVSGHGIPAALIVSMVKLAFWYQKNELPLPGTLFDRMNDLLLDNISGEFVTGCYAFVDLDRMQLSTTNAGHPPLFLWKRAMRQLLELRPDGRLLGLLPNAQFTVETVDIEKGDRILMYTDGVFEAQAADGSGDQFGLDRLRDFIVENEALSPDRFADRLMKTVIDYSGGNDAIDDDIAFVIIDIESEAPRAPAAPRRFWQSKPRDDAKTTRPKIDSKPPAAEKSDDQSWPARSLRSVLPAIQDLRDRARHFAPGDWLRRRRPDSEKKPSDKDGSHAPD